MAAVFFIGLLTVPFIHSAATGTPAIPVFDQAQYTAAELSTSILNDGIPDVWKTWYGLSVTDSTVANADYTGSGVMNREKFQLNIYPLAPAEPPESPLTPKPAAKASPKTNQAPASTSTPSPRIGSSDFKGYSGPLVLNHAANKGYPLGFFYGWVDEIGGWKAYDGNVVEVWRPYKAVRVGRNTYPVPNGEQFVELDGRIGHFGIKQQITNARAGTYIMSWMERGRSGSASGKNAYHVMVYDPDKISAPAVDVRSKRVAKETGFYQRQEFGQVSPTKWQQKYMVFTLSEKQIQENKIGFWLAFVPDNNNTYGVLIDKIRLSSVEIVQPKIKIIHDQLLKIDTEVGIEKDANGKDILESVNSVRFCRWSSAFPNGSFDQNFYKTDRDRFHIRIRGEIPGLSMITINTQNILRTVKGGKFTKKPKGDGVIEVAMQKENGDMISNPVLLVSDSDDDTKFNGDGTDDGKDDATLQGVFNGKINVVFPELGNATHEFNTMKPLGRIKVNIAYCSPKEGLIPQDIRNLINLQVLKAKKAYRQVGVELMVTDIWPYKIPDDEADKFVEEPPIPAPETSKEGIHNKIASRRLMNNLQKSKNDMGHTIPQDEILVGFVDGIVRTPEFPFTAVVGFSYGGPPIIMSLWKNNRKDHFALAHELGHIVAGVGPDHLPGSPEERLMVDGLHSRYKFDHLDSKRFSVKEQEAIQARKVGGLFRGYYIPLQ